jgi:enoyl-CoA hydratase
MGGTYAKPVIAAVNGAAVGGGLELVMNCDLVIAAEHARFGLPEVKRGLFAAGGGTLLSTRIPLALALEMGLTGRLIDAPRLWRRVRSTRSSPRTDCSPRRCLSPTRWPPTDHWAPSPPRR